MERSEDDVTASSIDVNIIDSSRLTREADTGKTSTCMYKAYIVDSFFRMATKLNGKDTKCFLYSKGEKGGKIRYLCFIHRYLTRIGLPCQS